jgi:hypothetical protein
MPSPMCATLSKRAYACEANTKDTRKNHHTHLLPMPKRICSHTARMLTHTMHLYATTSHLLRPSLDQALQAVN